MTKLGPLELDGSTPVVAVGFAAVDSSIIQAALAHGMDVAELRVDLYKSVDEQTVLSEVAKFRGIPSIATIRVKNEGGKWAGDDQTRLRLFSLLVKHVDAVDVELKSEIRDDVVSLAHNAKRLAVISFHDLHKTPPFEVLVEHVENAVNFGADIVKIATFAQTDADVQTLTKLLEAKRHANLIVIAMGPHGTKSRIFFPSLGSLLTFAAVGDQTAPGQLELEDMFDQLRLLYPEYNERKIIGLRLMEAV